MPLEPKRLILDATREALSSEQTAHLPLQKVGIVVGDVGNRRLLATIAESLALEPTVVDAAELKASRFADFELIIADEAIARELRPILTTEEFQRQQFKPALVAVVSSSYAPPLAGDGDESFDAVLTMPEKPNLLTAQLGVALYAYRAFSRRYQSALEELSLNRDISRSVTSGISIANAQLPDMPLMYVNPAFEAMTGYTLEDVEGKNCRFLQKEDTDQPCDREACGGTDYSIKSAPRRVSGQVGFIAHPINNLRRGVDGHAVEASAQVAGFDLQPVLYAMFVGTYVVRLRTEQAKCLQRSSSRLHCAASSTA